MTADWRAEVAALGADHLAPSSALAARASALLQRVAADAADALPEAARAVATCQPAMAALVNVANVALRAAEALGVGSVAAALAALQRGIELDRKAAALALCEQLQTPARVVTTSASANVVEALQALRRQDLLTGVVCSESRPLLEGTALARWLVDQGFATTLVTDAALAEWLVPGSVFLAGTDAILPAGIANKRGTRLFAAWARLASVPRYVLATRDKLYPPELAGCFANPMRPANELVQNPPPGLVIDNRAFDVSPRDVWTAVLVGSQPLAAAEASGDHALAAGLAELLEPRT